VIALGLHFGDPLPGFSSRQPDVTIEFDADACCTDHETN
jgi:hypothetical protein